MFIWLTVTLFMENTFITLAIHTHDYAVTLRRILEENGVAVRLENVDMNENSVASGVRVRIPAANLPLALKIVETSLSYPDIERAEAGGNVLIPIDFSDYGDLACLAGFAFAQMHGVEVVLLHVYSSPYYEGNLSVTDSFGLEIPDAKVRKEMEDAAKLEMKRFVSRLRKDIVAGKLPPVKFKTVLVEGVPEDAIMQYSKSHRPMLVVMATRGAHKKVSQMVGSVAAEVIDNCRLPVYTVPENFNLNKADDSRNAVFFCNIEQQDLLAMDVFMRLAGKFNIRVHLVPVSDRAGEKLPGRFKSLVDYCRERYPDCDFVDAIIHKENFRKDFEKYIVDNDIALLVVPNKKKNAFSRLFNPGMAHKVVFERDIPLLALPV